MRTFISIQAHRPRSEKMYLAFEGLVAAAIILIVIHEISAGASF